MSAVTVAAGCGGDDGRPSRDGQRVSRHEAEIRVQKSADRARERFAELGAAATAGAANQLTVPARERTPATMEEFLTTVTKDVDAYWTGVLTHAGLPEPRVNYQWVPPGSTVTSACTDATGQPSPMSDNAAAYCPADDTIYISLRFAAAIYSGALNDALPGSSAGYGRTLGDFAVAFIVAHEYAHNVQNELGLYQDYGTQLPVKAFELQADCMAGNWANSVYREGRLEDGDVQEALDAALAVGDFEPSAEGHHGTPQERYAAWSLGFESGDPSVCGRYLDPSEVELGATPEEIVLDGG